MDSVEHQIKDLAIYPGGDLVAKGVTDLGHGIKSEEALLVMVAGPRLRELGFEFEDLEGVSLPYEHALYEAIEARLTNGAHGEYNTLIQRIVSFANSYRAS